PPAKATRCSTTVCKQAADYIRNSINHKAKPCDDFWEYACGGWLAHHQIEPSKKETSASTLVEDEMIAAIRSLLEQPASANRSSTESASVQLSRHFFRQCRDGAVQNEPQMAVYFKELFDTIGGWRIGRPDGRRDGHS